MSKKTTKRALRKQINDYARLLHVYVSTALFALMIFFCFTGITLNHSWYNTEGGQSDYEQVPLAQEQLHLWGLASEGWEPDMNSISADLRTWYDLPVPNSIDIEESLGELSLEFNLPAGFVSVLIDSTGEVLVIERESGSVLGILNDLHKGRHSGEVWFWLIDLSAVLMIVFSITGLIILYQGKRYRRWANVTLFGGLLSPFILYLFCVPSA